MMMPQWRLQCGRCNQRWEGDVHQCPPLPPVSAETERALERAVVDAAITYVETRAAGGFHSLHEAVQACLRHREGGER